MRSTAHFLLRVLHSPWVTREQQCQVDEAWERGVVRGSRGPGEGLARLDTSLILVLPKNDKKPFMDFKHGGCVIRFTKSANVSSS